MSIHDPVTNRPKGEIVRPRRAQQIVATYLRECLDWTIVRNIYGGDTYIFMFDHVIVYVTRSHSDFYVYRTKRNPEEI